MGAGVPMVNIGPPGTENLVPVSAFTAAAIGTSGGAAASEVAAAGGVVSEIDITQIEAALGAIVGNDALGGPTSPGSVVAPGGVAPGVVVKTAGAVVLAGQGILLAGQGSVAVAPAPTAPAPKPLPAPTAQDPGPPPPGFLAIISQWVHSILTFPLNQPIATLGQIFTGQLFVNFVNKLVNVVEQTWLAQEKFDITTEQWLVNLEQWVKNASALQVLTWLLSWLPPSPPPSPQPIDPPLPTGIPIPTHAIAVTACATCDEDGEEMNL
jgi:hypothetical protein